MNRWALLALCPSYSLLHSVGYLSCNTAFNKFFTRDRTADNENEFFYRFRSIDALLGERNELEKQEIYFASPDHLNDPMEGFKDIFWSGDSIVWHNLIRHYLLCFMRKLSLVLIAGETYEAGLSKNIVFSSSTNHPTPAFENLYEEICASFFSEPGMLELPNLLAACKHQIRREELKFYLRMLHGLAVICVCNSFKKQGLMSGPPVATQSTDIGNTIENLFRVLSDSEKNHKDQERKSIGFLFQIADHVNKSFGLRRYFEAGEKRERIWQSAITDFPDEYVTSLDNLVFVNWYTACFVSDPNQAAMWGNYGDGHKGACLKFRSSENINGSRCLSLNRVLGWSASPKESQKNYGNAKHEFIKMNYVDRFIEVDFFRSIGRIAMPALNADWYMGVNGQKSSCYDNLFQREEEWRKEYWERFQAMISAKFLDWKHEGECRLVLYSMLEGFEDPADRKVIYNFADLEGIIFGLKTSIDDKKRIVDIIKKKCLAEKRTTFDFGQAFYSVENGKIEVLKQNLLDL